MNTIIIAHWSMVEARKKLLTAQKSMFGQARVRNVKRMIPKMWFMEPLIILRIKKRRLLFASTVDRMARGLRFWLVGWGRGEGNFVIRIIALYLYRP